MRAPGRPIPIDFKKLAWRALGLFTCGNLKEFLSKLIGNLSGELLVHLYRAIAMSLEGAPENVQVIDDDSQPIPKESGVGSRWEQLASSSKDQAGNQIVFDLD